MIAIAWVTKVMLKLVLKGTFRALFSKRALENRITFEAKNNLKRCLGTLAPGASGPGTTLGSCLAFWGQRNGSEKRLISGAKKEPQSQKIARTAPKIFLNKFVGFPVLTH